MAAPPILIIRVPRFSNGANLADAIHFLCALHGRHPGVVDLAAARIVDPAGRAWLASAAEGAAVERALLTRLAVAAGPIPSTPGGGGSESAIQAQRAALATLAQSDRKGCALGAALALAADWVAVRTVIGPRPRGSASGAGGRLGDEARLRAVATRPPRPSAPCCSGRSSWHCSTGRCGICSKRGNRRGGITSRYFFRGDS